MGGYGCVWFLVAFCLAGQNNALDPDVKRNASELISSKGYPVEEIQVQTEDGFILTVLHIPPRGQRSWKGHRSPPRGRRSWKGHSSPVVYLQHGILADCTNWIVNLANESLAFILSDAGYDVWMGNSRGNSLSRRHTKYDPSQEEFWEWSWDEMVKYDLPATIDAILARTNQKQLYYVGHSQGTLTGFAAMSRDKEFADKIKAMYALAPIGFVANIKGPLRIVAELANRDVQLFYDVFGHKDFLSNNIFIQILSETVCDSPLRSICADIWFLMGGFDAQQLNMTRMPVYMSHGFSGTSIQDMVHFSQMVNSSLIQMYDYGNTEDNLLHYGQATPPVYNLTNFDVPVTMYSGGSDWLADPQDVKRLIPILKNIKQRVQFPRWNHIDFILGLNATRDVYYHIRDEIDTLHNIYI